MLVFFIFPKNLLCKISTRKETEKIVTWKNAQWVKFWSNQMYEKFLVSLSILS